MTDQWDERTEQIPGKRDPRSIDLGVDLSGAAGDSRPNPMAFMETPALVVFEPTEIGLASALMQMGYRVRAAGTGVDIMSAVAASPPAVVLCAPGPDAERRRLLAAALRLRFPQIPIVYISTHASHEAAVLGAIREGARAVLPWPLPPAADVRRVLAPYLGRGGKEPDAQLDDPTTAPHTHAPRAAKPPASEEGPMSFEDLATAVLPHAGPQVSDLPSDAMMPLPVPLPVFASEGPTGIVGPAASTEASFLEPTTKPDVRRQAFKVPKTIAAPSAKRGELGGLMVAVGPFLWSLADAAEWAESLGKAGDPAAATHARTLKAVVSILGQIDARVEESGA